MKSGSWLAGRLELEVHRHGVAAEAEEHALPQAEHARIAPEQVDADGNDGEREELAKLVEAELGKERRRDHEEQQEHREDHELAGE